MNNTQTDKVFTFIISGFLMACLVTATFIWPQPALAHEGHAGSMLSFITVKEALKGVLPAGAKVVKRKELLDETAAASVKKDFGLEPDSELYVYYLASDKTSGQRLGSAIVTTASYRHGNISVVIGLDNDLRITQAALQGINEKYVVDFEHSVGKGFIPDYTGLSIKELIAKANELASADKPTRDFAAAVRDAALVLVAFQD